MVVQWLLDAGVNVYEADTSANTALSLASRQGHALVCKKLLDHRCGKQLLKMRNKRRQSPSDLATSGKHNDAKRVLQPSETDKQLDNEKVHEIEEQDQELQHCNFVIKFQEESKRVGAESKNEMYDVAGFTTLMMACRVSNMRSVEWLIEKKADVTTVARQTMKDTKGKESTNSCTALVIAAEQGCTEICQALLNEGASANELWDDKENNPKSDQFTALMLAAQNGHDLVVAMLVQGKADVNSHKGSRTVLMMAAQYGYTRCAQILIDGGADVNATNKAKETSLMFATRFGHQALTRLLHAMRRSNPCQAVAVAGAPLHLRCGVGRSASQA